MTSTDNPKNPSWDTRLSLTAKPGALAHFFPLLQKGITIEVEVGCTIKQLLEDQLGLTSEYVEKRIQTIFLDSKPVDDPGKAVIRNGATLTLSAAMPGLLGAMLRKQSICAVLRCQITHIEEKEALSSGKGFVVLRLFNFLGREVGPTLLKQGVGVSGDDIMALMGQQDAPIWGEVDEFALNGKKMTAKGLGKEILLGKTVFLQVREA